MATDVTAKTPAKDEEISSLDQAVRVRDLSSPITNPNIPRSVFREPLGSVDEEAGYISVTDGTHQPSKGFKEKSVKAQAIQMEVAFDANGNPGSPGDWLVNVNGHWFVAKDL